MPITGVLGKEEGLGNKLKPARDLEGPPGLVSPVGAGGGDVARLAAICAQACVVPPLALFRVEGAASPARAVDVHPVGVVAGRLVGLQAWLVRRGERLGGERLAGNGWRLAAPSGGLLRGQVGLHEDRCSHVRLKSKGGPINSYRTASFNLPKNQKLRDDQANVDRSNL